MAGVTAGGSDRAARWSLVTPHGLVLLLVDQHAAIRVADMAAALGLSERRTHMVLRDLVDDGYVERRRIGRENRYRVAYARPLRRDQFNVRTVGDLVLALRGLPVSRFLDTEGGPEPPPD